MKNKWGEELKPKTIEWNGQQVTEQYNCAIYTESIPVDSLVPARTFDLQWREILHFDV